MPNYHDTFSQTTTTTTGTTEILARYTGSRMFTMASDLLLALLEITYVGLLPNVCLSPIYPHLHAYPYPLEGGQLIEGT